MSDRNRPRNTLSCRDRAEWRAWLAAHGATETEVWLQIRKARSTIEGVRLDEAVEEALCYGWIDGGMHGLDTDSFVLRLTPRRPDSIWSLTNRERAERLIAQGRMTEAGMARIREAQANARWEAAYSARQAPELPPDLAAALEADPVAGAGFEHWPNSLKLQVVVWVTQSKRPQTRARRIDVIVGRARRGEAPFG
jgi:uncharacterized protein YdeI (YjbR/CyaY-like superfamily)